MKIILDTNIIEANKLTKKELIELIEILGNWNPENTAQIMEAARVGHYNPYYDKLLSEKLPLFFKEVK